MSDTEVPYEAWLMALLSLPAMGPARLAAFLECHDAVDGWKALVDNDPIGIDGVRADVVSEWRVRARDLDVAERWAATTAAGISVSELGGSGFPERLLHDIEPPLLLFRKGAAIGSLPTVAIVGTRRCTSYGRKVAFELGAALSEAGVSIVSGLAIGIDAAAHEGAMSVEAAPPIGVVGSGLDVVYPRRNRHLWDGVSTRGTLLAEAPPGARPERWRFPARNRIIAGLADAVIVVESHTRGGSLLTVDEAQLRDVPVGATPGPISSRASAGSNLLLVDGAVPVLGVDDVLLMIGHVAPKQPEPGIAVGEVDELGGSSELLDAMGFTPMQLGQLADLVGRPLPALAAEVERLVAAGACVQSGPWIERVR